MSKRVRRIRGLGRREKAADHSDMSRWNTRSEFWWNSAKSFIKVVRHQWWNNKEDCTIDRFIRDWKNVEKLVPLRIDRRAEKIRSQRPT